MAIVRISGGQALAVADRVFHCGVRRPSERPPRVAVIGHVGNRQKDGEWIALDQALLLTFRAPRSYTGEDVVELQVHGGRVSGRRVLQAVLAEGCRSAEPGEFTRRAFLNGKIDLIQAEAVCDLIRAHSDKAAESAALQLDGNLSAAIATIYERLASTSADLEATLDFPDEDIPILDTGDIIRRISGAVAMVDRLLATWNEGILLREGALVVIAGQPNAGKSTLMNCLLGKNRSIVTAIPGTTRDTIEESFAVDGVWIRLVDTAGLRESVCEIEKEGIRRAASLIEKADYILYVVDGSETLSDADRENIERIGRDRCAIIYSKADLGARSSAEPISGFVTASLSLRRDGVDTVLRGILAEYVRGMVSAVPHAAISERHRSVLSSVRSDLVEAAGLLQADFEGTCAVAATQIRQSLEAMGLLTGRNYSEELLDRIFSRFCVGK